MNEITGEGLRAENRRLKALVSAAFCAKVLGKALDAEWEAKAQALGCGWVTAHAPAELLEEALRWAAVWGTDVPTVTGSDVSAALATEYVGTGGVRGKYLDVSDIARARAVLLAIAEGEHTPAAVRVAAAKALLGAP